jgi:hypothetical protein
MSMPLPGEIRYPSTAAHREMRWETGASRNPRI